MRSFRPLETLAGLETGTKTMGLEDTFDSFDEGSNDAVQATHFKIQNPDHPDSTVDPDDETAATHFRAARFLQDRLGSRRNALVGKFAQAVYEYEINDDSEPLEQLFDDLTS